jgi:hypothetical protein
VVEHSDQVTAATECLKEAAWPPSRRTAPPAATRCRTRSGSTARAPSGGRYVVKADADSLEKPEDAACCAPPTSPASRRPQPQAAAAEDSSHTRSQQVLGTDGQPAVAYARRVGSPRCVSLAGSGDGGIRHHGSGWHYEIVIGPLLTGYLARWLDRPGARKVRPIGWRSAGIGATSRVGDRHAVSATRDKEPMCP